MKKDYVMYPAIMAKDKNENEYSIFFPDLDVASSGLDEKDAILSARELLGTVIFGLEEDGEKIPKPSDISDIKVKKDEFVTLIDVYMPAVRMSQNNKSVNRTVTLPHWLNALALSKNFNFSLVLQEALKEKLHIKV